MIPIIFNALTDRIKMLESKDNFLCQIRELALKHKYCDTNEFCLWCWRLNEIFLLYFKSRNEIV